jgi:probable HAF family extracellular repeat protein
MRLSWLGTLGGLESRAYGVALVAPVVVGWSYDASGKKRAFRWENGEMKDLGTLGGDESAAYAVSASGEVVVGWAYDGLGRKRAFRWTAVGGMQDLGTLGGHESEAYSISANGQVVVGWAEDHNKQRRAFYWDQGGMHDLGTLGGNNSEACSVSAGGELVVGWSENARGRHEAFYWMQHHGIMALPVPRGTNHSYALGMTPEPILFRRQSIYQITGYATTSVGTHHGLIWELRQQTVPPTSAPPVVSLKMVLGASLTISKAYSASYDPPPASGSVGMSLTVVGEWNTNAALWRIPRQSRSQCMGICLLPTSPTCFSRLEVARAICSFRSNPRLVVGWGYNSQGVRTEAFLLEMP